MEIGIIGLPQSGKSTIFEIMTTIPSQGVHEPFTRGQAVVSDERLEHIARSFASRSVVPAKITCVDVNATGEKAWERLRQHLSAAVGLIHVVDAFSTSTKREIIANYKKLNDEMIISDLLIAEGRLQRLAKMAKMALKPIDVIQMQILPAVVEHLEAGKLLTTMTLTAAERSALKSFSFWSIKPQLVVINIAETEIGKASLPPLAEEAAAPMVVICAKTELELLSLPVAERQDFLEVLGIEQPAFGKLVSHAFTLLEQICFFTAGEKESRAWLTERGSKAPRAAGVIHKDFERGFIKAEVIGYQDFLACNSSLTKVKEAGKFRLEGKEYIVQEGDIITFRFNV